MRRVKQKVVTKEVKEIDAGECRDLIKSAIKNALSTNELWDCIDSEGQNYIVTEIEKSCMNETIKDCTACFIRRAFDEPKFMERYSARCARIISNLDSGSSVSSNYLSDIIIKEYLDSSDGNIPILLSIGNMDSKELNPESSIAERQILEIRKNQKIEHKYSTNVPCPKCGAKRADRCEVQTAALDEISRFRYECMECNNVWLK